MIYLIIATICFSLSFGLIKSQLSTLPSEFVVFFRLLIASLIFVPLIKKEHLRKHLLAIIIGIIQFGIMYLCFFKAFKYLQGNEVALLTTTTPIFVALWSCLFGERFKTVYIFCILLSVIGAGIIVWENLAFESIIKGILLMETTNCTFALGQVLWKKHIGQNETQFMSSAYFGAVIFVLPFMLFGVDFASLNISLNQILSLLYLGFIPTGLGFWLWNKGATMVETSLLAIMNNLKIPLGVLFSIFLFKENINVLNFVLGTFVIIFSIVLLHFSLKSVTKCK